MDVRSEADMTLMSMLESGIAWVATENTVISTSAGKSKSISHMSAEIVGFECFSDELKG